MGKDVREHKVMLFKITFSVCTLFRLEWKTMLGKKIKGAKIFTGLCHSSLVPSEGEQCSWLGEQSQI